MGVEDGSGGSVVGVERRVMCPRGGHRSQNLADGDIGGQVALGGSDAGWKHNIEPPRVVGDVFVVVTSALGECFEAFFECLEGGADGCKGGVSGSGMGGLGFSDRLDVVELVMAVFPIQTVLGVYLKQPRVCPGHMG